MVGIKGLKLLSKLVLQMATKLLNGPPHKGPTPGGAQDGPNGG